MSKSYEGFSGSINEPPKPTQPAAPSPPEPKQEEHKGDATHISVTKVKVESTHHHKK